MRPLRSCRLLALVLVTVLLPAPGLRRLAGEPIELQLQSREPATGQVRVTPTQLDPSRLGVVVVDIWNWHWCKTAAARVGSFVPRLNHCLHALRGLGAQVFLCPTDVVDAYVGTPQREKALGIDLLPLPAALSTDCPRPPNGPGCACIERCRGNYGWNAMHPGLDIGQHDLMPNSRQALYTLAKQRDITHLLYLGVHTQVCLLGKDIGLRNMKALGFECILGRDLTDSHPDYDPTRGIDPDDLTARTVAHFERYLCSTVNLGDELRRLGQLRHQGPLDPVRAAPWGTAERPHLFKKATTVTLSTPLVPGAVIHYTTDGTSPTPASTRYEAPFPLDESAVVRAQAYTGGEAVCVESRFDYFKLPALPPRPDVHLADIVPSSVLGPGHSPSDHSHRFSPGSRPPQSHLSNRGQPLELGGRTYTHGLGVHAPSRVAYAVDPSWKRFVAVAGIDENLRHTNNASDLGCLSSVVFRVLLDGEVAAESPLMRFLHPPWHFDVPIPAGTRQVVLVAHPGRDGNREDVANWVDAGFVTGGPPAHPTAHTAHPRAEEAATQPPAVRTVVGAAEESATPVEVGVRKQLFVDDHIVAESLGVERVLGSVTKANGGKSIFPARFYGTVLHDGGSFKMWYRKEGTQGYDYAESRNGLEFKTQAAVTGIPFAGDYNLAVEIDPHETDPAHRYKAGFDAVGMAAGIAHSADGIRWTPYNDGQPVTFRAADCHNQVLWDPLRATYRLVTRTDFGGGGGPFANTVAKRFEVRGTRMMTNKDLKAAPSDWQTVRNWHFDREGSLEYLRRQVYSMTVWIYEEVYFTLLSVYEHPGDVREGVQTDHETRHERDVMEFYIATSRDGDSWDLSWVYAGQPIVPRGPAGSFDKDVVFPSSTVVTYNDRHWLYYSGANERHGTAELDPHVWFGRQHGIGLATLRLDGFVGLRAGTLPGTVVTRPFRVEGERLEVNVDAASGSIAVDVLDADGRDLPGFSGKAARVYDGVDALRLAPRWQAAESLAPLRGRTIRLRFGLEQATLYAFQVR